MSTLDQEMTRERALVRAGWELVELLGQLETGRARKLLAHRWQAGRERAAATLTPLKTGASIGGRIGGCMRAPRSKPATSAPST